MATFDFSGMPEILAELRRRGEEGEAVGQAMLDAGAAAAVASWRNTITRLGLVKTGAMRDSIAPTGRGSYREITAKGKDQKGVRNGQKAFVLHYGTSRITATYWWDEAYHEAEPLVNAAMRRVWDIYVQTGEIITTGGAGGQKKRGRKADR